MKKTRKALSILLALTLALSMFSGLTVFAEEGNGSSAAAGSNSAVIPESSSAAENGGEESDPAATPAPTEIPSALYITAYDVNSFAGEAYDVGERATVVLKFTDEWANATGATILARMNSNAFTAADQYAVKQPDGTYLLIFPDVVYNGGSKDFSVDLIYDQPREVQKLTQSLEKYISTANPGQPAPNEPDLPKIMVKDFTFGGTSVQAGKEFVLDLTLFTTSGNTDLKDVMVGLNFGDSKSASLASGSMNTYVGTMAPGSTRHITYLVTTDATMEPGAISLNVELSSKNGSSSSYPISIPVVQLDRFEITGMEAPEMMMLGEEAYLSVTFVNKGKTIINNLSAEIMGSNLANPGQSQFLGNVAPGTENSVDFSVMASEVGTINGTIVLSYEDAKGEVQKVEKEFSCTVEEMPEFDPSMGYPGMMPDDMAGMEPEQAGMPVWGWALIAVGAVAVVVIVVVVVKKKKAKKLALLEDEDEDI